MTEGAVRDTVAGIDPSLLETLAFGRIRDALADRVILVAEGRLVFDGKPQDLVAGGGTLDDRFYELTRGSAA